LKKIFEHGVRAESGRNVPVLRRYAAEWRSDAWWYAIFAGGATFCVEGRMGPMGPMSCSAGYQFRETALDRRTWRNDAAIRFALCLFGVRSRDVSSTHTIHMESTHSTTIRGFKRDFVFTSSESQLGSGIGRQRRLHGCCG
jgi:hypothetical protein